MSQRLYRDYDRALHEIDTNSSRQKTSKMAEIEAYVNVLIDNNRSYADEINSLKRDNTDLRGQLEVLMGESLRQKEKHQLLLSETRSDYNKEVGQLIDELKDILNKKEQTQSSYKSLLEQLTYQSEFDKKARGLQLTEIERNYEHKIKVLNDRLAEQSRQIEKNFYTNSDSKIRMVKEIDSLNYEVCELRKENNDLRQAHMFDENEMARLSSVIKTLNKQKEEMGVNLLKMEQDKNNQIIDLKQSTGMLREQLNDQIDNIKKLQTALSTKQKELQSMSDRHQIQSRSKGEYESELIKIRNELSEKNNELNQIRSEYGRLSDLSAKQTKRMSELIRVLEADNKKILLEKQETDHQSRIRQEQIYTLLDQVRALQNQNEQLAENYFKKDELSQQLDQEANSLREEVESLALQLKNEQEKGRLQHTHIGTLEQIIQKQKKRNVCLQNNSLEREFVANQVPGKLSEKYEVEIHQVLKKCQIQKSEMAQRYELENERLIRMYEKALREKEMTFKDKITLLERQIMGLSNA